MPKLTSPTRSYVDSSPFERLVGFLSAAPFTLVYILAPLHLLAAICLLMYDFRSPLTWTLIAPIAISMLTPAWVSVALSPYVLGNWCARQIPKYFRYEEYHEIGDDELKANHASGKRYILVAHPHGVFSFCGVCGAIATMADKKGGIGPALPLEVPTAAASVIRFFPILKDVLGVFGVIDAAGPVLKKRLARNRGSFVLYVGGIAELFASSPKEEAVVLKARKGFIKLALQTGADVIPVYFFGNTTVLSTVRWAPIAKLSRKMGVSVTYFWGRFGLPVPNAVKLVYARGRPLGLPQIAEPTSAQIDQYHDQYCAAIKALFDNYKSTNPDYAHKELQII